MSTPPPDRSGPRDQQPDLSGLPAALPGVARLAFSSWWNTTQWSVATGWKLTGQLAHAVRDPAAAAALAHELGVGVGIVLELGRQVSDGVPLPKALIAVSRMVGEEPAGAGDVGGSGEDQRERMRAQLRERGEELLQRSRDVWNTDQAHPAYERILDELAPDEARILVLLHRAGPQPAVDVRTGGPVGMVSSRLVCGGLTMIGARAGCRYLDDVPSYLDNLFRLGTIWFSRETLRDPAPYQVLEAQPDVLEAMHSVKMAKVVRRSIALTSFGADFCRTVLVSDPVVPDGEPGG